MKIERFNIRVYGLLIREGKVLVTDEVRGGHEMTKFPGGGLEFGEGTADCLKREFQEELGIDISVDQFYYTNDFLQVSRFNKRDQLHSIYYKVSSDADLSMYKEEGFQPITNKAQRFRWVAFGDLNPEEFTFPLDKLVAEQLSEQ